MHTDNQLGHINIEFAKAFLMFECPDAKHLMMLIWQVKIKKRYSQSYITRCFSSFQLNISLELTAKPFKL